MQQTEPDSLEKQSTREPHVQAESDYQAEPECQAESAYGGDFPGRETLEERSPHYGPMSGGFLNVAYERFLQMPVPVVLMVLWFAGMILLMIALLTLYLLGKLLASMAGV